MRVFMSYASENKTAAEAIAFSLRSRGHHVFFDRDDLPDGASYDDRIEAAVENSDLFIFLITPEAVAQGRFTMTELKFARHKWRNPSGFVLPVMLTPTPMADVPSYLKAVTLLEPQGNAAAEVSFAAERLRGAERALNIAALCALAGAAAALIAGFMPVVIKKNSWLYLGSKEFDGIALEPGIIFAVLFIGIIWKLGTRYWWKAAALAAFTLAAWIACVSLLSLDNKFLDVSDWNVTDILDRLPDEQKAENQEKINKYNEWIANQSKTLALVNVSAVFALKVLVGALILFAGFSLIERSFRNVYRWITIAFAAVVTGAIGGALLNYFIENVKSESLFLFVEPNDIAFAALYAPFLIITSGLIGFWLVRGQDG